MPTMTEVILGKDGRAVRPSGLWIKDKFHYLGRYLKIFSVGMKDKWTLYYVDLFAGPGRCKIRETGEELDGSPLIALLAFDFDKYYFIEADQECFEALSARVSERAPQKQGRVTLIPGDCNQEIDKVAPPPNSLGVAFIDPTGLSPLVFETIRRLTKDRKLDLIINFQEGMGVRMNFHQYVTGPNTALDAFMDSDRWRQRFQTELVSFPQACREISNEYIENLRKLGYLAFNNDRIAVTTSQNTLLYYLLFASKHPRGNDFWRKIGRVGPHGQKTLGFE